MHMRTHGHQMMVTETSNFRGRFVYNLVILYSR